LAEQHEMPEIPGFGIEDSRRSRPECGAKRIVPEEGARHTNILGGSELHELTEQEMRSCKRLGGR
jgi:hypothetical protein